MDCCEGMKRHSKHTRSMSLLRCLSRLRTYAHPQHEFLALLESAMDIQFKARLSRSVPTRSSRNWPSALAMYSSTISRWCGSVMECATATLPSEMRATWSASGASWSSCAANACRTTATLSVAPTSVRPVRLVTGCRRR